MVLKLATDNEMIDLLLKIAESEIDIVVKRTVDEKNWGKSLDGMPIFTIREIEIHRQNSGKMPGVSIIKTLERGRKFKEKRYISADSIYTYLSDFFKAKCKASMKREFRNIEISLSRSNGLVIFGKCTCPAGNSSYYNYVMALLLEITDYSLNELKVVPQDVSCTSKSCQWGIPSTNQKSKEPVMNSDIQNVGSKKRNKFNSL